MCDSSGRLNAVTGSDNLYYGVSNYASNFQYRAWVYTKGGYSDSPPLTFDRLPYDYGITGIHEMLHQIGKYMSV